MKTFGRHCINVIKMLCVCWDHFYIHKVLFLLRNLLDGRERPYPNDNYLSGDGKSMVWSGHGYYVPNNRSWKKHHEVKALPNAQIPDLVEFQHEDQWRDWQKKRDTPGSGNFCASSGMSVFLQL